MGGRLRGAHRCGIEQPRPGALLERRHAAQRIACVALAQILQKAGKCSSDSFFFQLFIAPFRPGLGACGEEHFEARVGKHDRAHVAPFGHQPRGFAKGSLPLQQGPAHRGQRGSPGGRRRACLGANRVRHPLLVEQDVPAFEANREPDREGSDLLLVAGVDAFAHRGKRHEAIQSAAVEIIETQRLCDFLRDGAFSRRRRAVDRDDRNGLGSHTDRMRSPAARASSTKPGNEVATLAQSSTSIGSLARSAAMAKDIAMRWSPREAIFPPAYFPPRMRMPSDSFTRSSAAPARVVSPSALAAAMKSAGNSSIAGGTSRPGMATPMSLAWRTRRSASGSPPALRSFSTAMSAPISLRMSTAPARVGFIPTPVSVTSEPGEMLAPTMKNAADEMSAGTARAVALSGPGETRTESPSRCTGWEKAASIRSV